MDHGRRQAGQARQRAPLPPGFFTLWSTVAIDLIGFGIVLPILPLYAERFGASGATIGVLTASFSLASLAFSPVWGRLSDRIGRKPILIISLFGTALGSLVTGAAGALWLLFAGRVIDGISGASVSVAQAAAADLAGPRDRARLMGLLGAAFGVGFVAGPALGALAALGGPQVPFYLAAAISLVNALVAIRRLPETRHAGAGQRAGEPVAAPATAGGEHGVGGRGDDGRGDDGRVDDGRGDDGIDPDADLDGERLAAVPTLDGPGLAEPAHLGLPHERARAAVVRLVVVSFVGMLAFSGFEATFSLVGERRLGLAMASTGAVFTVIGLGLFAVQGGLVGTASARIGEMGTIRLGLAANAAGFVLLAPDLGWLGLVPALVLLVLGQGLLTATISSSIAGRAGEHRGRWLGWQQSAGGLARVIGPVVAGALFQYAGAGTPSVLGAVLSLVALAAVAGIGAGLQVA